MRYSPSNVCLRLLRDWGVVFSLNNETLVLSPVFCYAWRLFCVGDSSFALHETLIPCDTLIPVREGPVSLSLIILECAQTWLKTELEKLSVVWLYYRWFAIVWLYIL